MEFLFLRALRALGMPFACLIIALTVVLPAPVYAGSSSAFITGTVTNGGKPSAHVVVTAAGNNLTVKTTTEGKGDFSFPSVALGTYDVEARDGDLRGLVRDDLASGDCNVSHRTRQQRNRTRRPRSVQSLTIHGSGSGVVTDNAASARQLQWR